MKSAAKFKRTNKIINLNTNKSKYSGSETSSTKSFYIPQNKITDKFKRTNFVERQISF